MANTNGMRIPMTAKTGFPFRGETIKKGQVFDAITAANGKELFDAKSAVYGDESSPDISIQGLDAPAEVGNTEETPAPTRRVRPQAPVATAPVVSTPAAAPASAEAPAVDPAGNTSEADAGSPGTNGDDGSTGTAPTATPDQAGNTEGGTEPGSEVAEADAAKTDATDKTDDTATDAKADEAPKEAAKPVVRRTPTPAAKTPAKKR